MPEAVDRRLWAQHGRLPPDREQLLDVPRPAVHLLGLLLRLILITQQMKGAVQEEPLHLFPQRLALHRGLPRRGGYGDHDIAQHARLGVEWKAQDVGGLVLAAVFTVEPVEEW